jgi:hypothetical protein
MISGVGIVEKPPPGRIESQAAMKESVVAS